MVLATAERLMLGTETEPRLRVGQGPKNGAAFGRRLLMLDGKPAFTLSLWCGTCPFLFERLEGANSTVSLAEMEDGLAVGLQGIEDDIVQRFGELLPRGSFIPLLLSIQPQLIKPLATGDYFAEEQLETWAIDSFWGLPEYPHTPYYRTFETPVDTDAHLYEFVVPMVPPSWNKPARVAEHAARLAESSRPTAVAVSILDVCQPAMSDESRDYYAHWGLTHFLLDGHHKMQAAAQAGKSLQLLALLSVDASLAAEGQVAQVADLRSRPPTRRPTLSL
jgi:hypothetical protein